MEDGHNDRTNSKRHKLSVEPGYLCFTAMNSLILMLKTGLSVVVHAGRALPQALSRRVRTAAARF
jgi:hypothetical protein